MDDKKIDYTSIFHYKKGINVIYLSPNKNRRNAIKVSAFCHLSLFLGTKLSEEDSLLVFYFFTYQKIKLLEPDH